jgi:hypothetical protein
MGHGGGWWHLITRVQTYYPQDTHSWAYPTASWDKQLRLTAFFAPFLGFDPLGLAPFP